MLYRATTVGIVVFWIVMMGMLVRLETHPEQTGILDVPVPFVMRLMFKHGQNSFLSIRQGTQEIGTVYLRPTSSGTNARTLNYSGTLMLQPGVPAGPRLAFGGALDLDGALRVRDFHTEITLRQPDVHLALKGDVPGDTLTLQSQFNGGPMTTGTQSLHENPMGLVTKALGYQLPIAPISVDPENAKVSAREAQIELKGEKLEVYQITVGDPAAPGMSIYFTQLGQIVSATTSIGYSLAIEQ